MGRAAKERAEKTGIQHSLKTLLEIYSQLIEARKAVGAP
jgi:hypothetical protein